MKDMLGHPCSTNAAPAELELCKLGFSYDAAPILLNITLQFTGRRLGIIGRNGSGKSTLIRLIAGLLRPKTGTIRINGFDPAQDRNSAVRHIGMLFQNPDQQIIFPTVEEEISFGLRQLGLPQQERELRVSEILARFDKSSWRSTQVHTLSQGQRHLICLMAVLAMRPNWICLDEPLAGLDLPTKMHLRRYLAQSGARMIHVTHDPEELREYDHVIWINAGRIAAAGEPDAILQHYSDEMHKLGAQDAQFNLS